MFSCQRSASFMCLFLIASSRAANVSRQVGCGWYQARKDWYEVFDGTAKHTLGWGELGAGVRGVVIL